MTPRKAATTLSKLIAIAFVAVGIFALCAPSAFALFSNGGFESGDFSGWTKTQFLNLGLTLPQPFTGASINRYGGGDDLTQIRGPYTEMSQADPNTGNVLHYPLSGSYCAVVNFQGNMNNGNSLTQATTASSADVQSDGKIHVQFGWAAVVQNPNHPADEQPYVYVAVKDLTKSTTLYETFIFAGDPSSPIPWHTYGGTQYTDWQVIDVAPDSSALAVGDQVSIEVTAAGCSQGGHWGYVYVDHFGSFHPVAPTVTVANKSYDGSSTATITGRSLSGAQSGDAISLSGGTASFDTARAGTAKTVTVTGLTLSGADAEKYMLTSFTATTTADITAIAPTVTTTTPSALKATSATSGGNVTSDGGDALSARGVCWSTSADPTIADNHTTDGTATGSFSSAVSGLTENTTYHVRAYATNSAGTSYGSDLSVTTTFTLSFVTDGTAGATLSGTASQNVALGGSASAVTANAPLHHHFINWTFSSGSPSTSNPLTLTSVAGSTTATAHFALDSFALTLPVIGSGTTIAAPDQASYDYGSQVQLTATPATGWHFANWSGDVSGSSDPVTVPIDAAKTVSAHFAIDTFALSYAPGPHGTLSGVTSQSIDYGADGSQVTAVPDAHYHFVSWSDGVLTAARTETGVTADHDLSASFAIDTFALSYAPGSHGTLSGVTSQSVDYGADGSQVTAVPGVGYRFLRWSDGVLTATRTDVSVTANHDVTASFGPADPPITTAKGMPSGWSGRSVHLNLAAVPSAQGAAVAYTEYCIGSGPWFRGTAVSITAEGTTVITYRSVDTAGNVETTKTCQVCIDRTAPKVRVGGEVNASWGGPATFRYRLSDNLATALRCKLVITYHGRVVATKALGLRPVGRQLSVTLRRLFPSRGGDAYGWRIVAFDPAGNRGVDTGGEFEVWRGPWH
jgi:hypothetical protein